MLDQDITKAVLQNSCFSHAYRRDDAVCLYHALSLRTVYGSQLLDALHTLFREPMCADAAAAQLAQYPQEIVWQAIRDLREADLLVGDPVEDHQLYLGLFQKGFEQYRIQHMYFIPTTGCNFRCRYCFVEADDRSFVPTQMSQGTAQKGLEVFARLTQEAPKITITFYGGEPLLNADVTYFGLRYTRKLEAQGAFAKPVNLSLLTNGSLVDQRTIEVLGETKTSVSVSIDGPQPYHDANRITSKGRASYEDALRGFRLLQDAGLQPGVSCTLSRYNIDHIEEIAEFVVNELHPPGMGFNILLPTISGDSPVGVSDEFAASQLIRAFVILREHGIYEDRVMRRVKPYTAKRMHFKDCMGVGGQIVITPDGRVGPCQAYLGLDEYFPLRVDELHTRLDALTSADIYAERLLDEWRHRFPLNMKECANCEAIGICGGGCPYAAKALHGSIWQVDERVCSQSKQVLEWMIWDTLDHFAAEPALEPA